MGDWSTTRLLLVVNGYVFLAFALLVLSGSDLLCLSRKGQLCCSPNWPGIQPEPAVPPLRQSAGTEGKRQRDPLSGEDCRTCDHHQPDYCADLHTFSEELTRIIISFLRNQSTDPSKLTIS